MGQPLTVRLPFEPRPHQRDAHARRKRFTVLVWHRRAGKTVYVVIELLLAAIACTRPMGEFGLVAPKLKQAKKNAWKYIKFFARAIPGIVINESELFVQLPHNGAKLRLYGADDPDSIRGDYFDGVALDEVAQMKPEVWGEIVRPMLADRKGWCIFIGTPKGVNLFSQMYYRALGSTDEDWWCDVRRWNDTNALDPAEVEKARGEMSEAEFQQEFECDFTAASDDVLIPLPLVLAAQGREIMPAEYRFAAKVLGVDVARYGGDRSVLFGRQGLMSTKPKVLSGLDTMAVASQVAETADKWLPDMIFVDQGGIGAGVLDRLLQLNYDAVGVDFGGKASQERFENKRVEMWWAVKDWLGAGGCLKPGIKGLAEELSAPTFTYKNARGRCQLESKDDLKKRGLPSPDLADALALTFAAPVQPKPLGWQLPGQERRGAMRSDFDPYAEDRDRHG